MTKYRKILMQILLIGIGISMFHNIASRAQVAGQSDLQDVQQIVAIVNDEVISLFDLKQRARLLMLSTGRTQFSQEEGQFLQRQAMDALIDDRLKIQEADEYDAGMTNVELAAAFENYAAQFNLEAEELEEQLKAAGVEKDTLITQIEGSLAWNGVVQGLLQPLVNVTDDEVQNFIDKMERDKGKFQYRLSEIFILVTDNSRREESLESARLMKQRMDNDIPFSAVAQQFSQSATASVGGDLGWLMLDEIPKEIREIVPDMEPRTISDPIVTEEGIYIISLVDKRRILTLDERDIRVTLKYIYKEQSAPSEADLLAYNQSVAQRLRQTDVCENAEAVTSEINATSTNDLSPITIRELNDEAAEAILNLEVGAATEFFYDDDGYRSFVLCNKDIPEVNLPDFDTVLQSLTQSRLQLLAKRHLRDLRRDAIVDYR